MQRDLFSTARHTEEGAPQGAQACSAVRITISWGAHSRKAVVLLRFRLQMCLPLLKEVGDCKFLIPLPPHKLYGLWESRVPCPHGLIRIPRGSSLLARPDLCS